MDPFRDDEPNESLGGSNDANDASRPTAPESEVGRLRRELAAMKDERNYYLRLCMAEWEKTLPQITQADIDAAVPFRPWFDELVRELEAK